MNERIFRLSLASTSLWMFALTGSAIAGDSQDQPTKTVQVTGEAVTGQAALRDALRKALEQGAGVQIAAYSRTENFELIRDTIFSRAEGLVKSYKVLDEGQRGDGTSFCTIEAVVSSDAVAKAWGEVQNVLGQIGRPSVMVYIRESVDGQPDDGSVLESRIESRLIKLGFDVYDSTHLDALQSKEAAAASQSGDDQKMAALAKGFGAQMFVVGTADANRAENTSPHGVNLVMYNCDARAKVYYTDTAKLLASDALTNVRGGARGFTEHSRQAGKTAISHAAEPLIDLLYETVMKSWSTEISGGGEIRFEISGFQSASQAFALKKRLEAIPGVQALYGPDYSAGHAVFRIVADATAQEFVELLFADDWNSILEITDVKLHRVQAKWAGDR